MSLLPVAEALQRVLAPASIARSCAPHVLANPDGHAEVRAAMRAKYGWRDAWIALLFDTTHSRAVVCRVRA